MTVTNRRQTKYCTWSWDYNKCSTSKAV